MLKTSQTLTKSSNKLFAICDLQSFFSKLVESQTLYQIRQIYIPLHAEATGREYIPFDHQKAILKQWNEAALLFNSREFNPNLYDDPATAVKKVVALLSKDNYYPDKTLLMYHAKSFKEFGLLHSQTAQASVTQVDRSMTSFFCLCRQVATGEGTQKPNLPSYKHNLYGRAVVTFTNQQVKRNGDYLVLSHKALTETEILDLLGQLHEGDKLQAYAKTLNLKCLSQSKIRIKSDIDVSTISEVRIVPTSNYNPEVYMIEIVYEDKETTVEYILGLNVTPKSKGKSKTNGAENVDRIPDNTNPTPQESKPHSFLHAVYKVWAEFSINKQYQAKKTTLTAKYNKQVKKDNAKLEKLGLPALSEAEIEAGLEAYLAKKLPAKEKIRAKPLNIQQLTVKEFKSILELAYPLESLAVTSEGGLESNSGSGPGEFSNFNLKEAPFKSAAIDMGTNNLMAVTFSDYSRPLLVKSGKDGLGLLGFNQWANKLIAEIKSELRTKHDKHTSRKLCQLLEHRNRIIKDMFHKATKALVAEFVRLGVEVVIIGHNVGMKQNSNMGKQNNQASLQIPHHKLKQMLAYKCAEVGIITVMQEESYTSQASWLNNDPIPVYKKSDDDEEVKDTTVVDKVNETQVVIEAGSTIATTSVPPSSANEVEVPIDDKDTANTVKIEEIATIPEPTRKKKKSLYKFSGTRHKGVYRCKDGRRIHADVNGSYNTSRKFNQTLGLSEVPSNFGRRAFNQATIPVVLMVDKSLGRSDEQLVTHSRRVARVRRKLEKSQEKSELTEKPCDFESLTKEPEIVKEKQ